jgi:hypothetical protein
VLSSTDTEYSDLYVLRTKTYINKWDGDRRIINLSKPCILEDMQEDKKMVKISFNATVMEELNHFK